MKDAAPHPTLHGVLLAALLGVVAAPCLAQSTEQSTAPRLLQTEVSRRLLAEGRRDLLAFRMPAAERHFRALAERPDGAAAGRFYLAAASMYKGMVTGDPAYFEEFSKRSDRFREALEDMPEGVWRAQLEAEGDLQRALVGTKTQSYFQAALAGRSAFNGYEALIEAHPRFADAYLGMGLLHLTVASLPGGWRRLLGVLGFSGSAEEGLRELRFAAQESRYHREAGAATLALVQIVIYQDTERGLALLRPLYEAHPQSLLFAHLYGFALLMDRQAQAAEEVLRGAVARHDDPDYFFIDYIEYYLAEALFRQNAFFGAETYYRRYLARHGGPALKAQATLMLAFSLEMQGRREAALTFYRRVQGTRDFDSDAAAYREAQHRLAHPLEGLERTLLLGRNAFDAGRYDEALRLLASVFNDPNASAGERAEAAYRRGRVFHVQGRLRRAPTAYAYAAAYPGNPHAKWEPWSRFYLGQIHAARGEEQAALDAYAQALAHDEPFDYAQALEQAVRVAREEIKGGS